MEIDVDSEQVSVVDNGVGMSEEVLVEAVKLGVDMSEVVAKKAGAKGRFSLGMKTACASMGRWWAVYTRPAGDQDRRTGSCSTRGMGASPGFLRRMDYRHRGA